MVLWAANNDAVEFLHVGVNGVMSGGLSAACRTTNVCELKVYSFWRHLAVTMQTAINPMNEHEYT